MVGLAPESSEKKDLSIRGSGSGAKSSITICPELISVAVDIEDPDGFLASELESAPGNQRRQYKSLNWKDPVGVKGKDNNIPLKIL